MFRVSARSVLSMLSFALACALSPFAAADERAAPALAFDDIALPLSWNARDTLVPLSRSGRSSLRLGPVDDPRMDPFPAVRPEPPRYGLAGPDLGEPSVRSISSKARSIGFVYRSGPWTFGLDHRQSYIRRGEFQKSQRIFFGAERKLDEALSLYAGYARTPTVGLLYRPSDSSEFAISFSGKPSKEIRNLFQLSEGSDAILAIVYRHRF